MVVVGARRREQVYGPPRDVNSRDVNSRDPNSRDPNSRDLSSRDFNPGFRPKDAPGCGVRGLMRGPCHAGAKWARWGSNPHALRPQILSPLRLPVSPRALGAMLPASCYRPLWSLSARALQVHPVRSGAARPFGRARAGRGPLRAGTAPERSSGPPGWPRGVSASRGARRTRSAGRSSPCS